MSVIALAATGLSRRVATLASVFAVAGLVGLVAGPRPAPRHPRRHELRHRRRDDRGDGGRGVRQRAAPSGQVQLARGRTRRHRLGARSGDHELHVRELQGRRRCSATRVAHGSRTGSGSTTSTPTTARCPTSSAAEHRGRATTTSWSTGCRASDGRVVHLHDLITVTCDASRPADQLPGRHPRRHRAQAGRGARPPVRRHRRERSTSASWCCASRMTTIRLPAGGGGQPGGQRRPDAAARPVHRQAPASRPRPGSPATDSPERWPTSCVRARVVRARRRACCGPSAPTSRSSPCGPSRSRAARSASRLRDVTDTRRCLQGAASPGAARRSHRAPEPVAAQRPPPGRAEPCRRGRTSRSRCCSWTSTSSRRSTTRSAITSATRCWSRCPAGWRSSWPRADVIARLGGDEFAIAAHHRRVARPAPAPMAEQIELALQAPFRIDELRLQTNASIGIAIFPEHGIDAETLTQRADVAMYMAKRSGGGHAVYGRSSTGRSVRRLALLGDLRRAIDHDELVLHFQPMVDLRTGRDGAGRGSGPLAARRARAACRRASSSSWPRPLGVHPAAHPLGAATRHRGGQRLAASGATRSASRSTSRCGTSTTPSCRATWREVLAETGYPAAELTPRAHRDRADGRPGPRPRGPGRARPAGRRDGGRRLRHRLLVAHLPARICRSARSRSTGRSWPTCTGDPTSSRSCGR